MWKIAMVTLAVAASAGVGAQEIAPTALNSYTAAPTKLAQASVFQQDGSLLGNIHRVMLAAGGRGQVVLGVAGGREITISTAEASYDEGSNVVVTDAAATKKALGSP